MSIRFSSAVAAAAVLAVASMAHAQQVFDITADTFIDSGSPGSPNPGTGQPNGGSGAIVNGQDIYSYGVDGKVKAVASNYSSSYPYISYTHVLFNLPQSFWTAIGSGQVGSVTVSYFPFNDSLDTADAHDNMEIHPLTHAFTVGNGTQSPLVASTTGGATWETYDGAVADAWSTPGGDYDANNYVLSTATDSTLPVSKGSVPFTWDITALINNPATRAELETNGALIKVTNETEFPPTSEVPVPPGVNDFVSFYSANYMAAMGTSNPAFLPVVTVNFGLTWDGQTDQTTWNSAIGNWNNGTSSSATYSDGSDVTFDSDITPANAFSITLNSVVAPGSITFDGSSAAAFTISGMGSIGGRASLVKNSPAR